MNDMYSALNFYIYYSNPIKKESELDATGKIEKSDKITKDGRNWIHLFIH